MNPIFLLVFSILIASKQQGTHQQSDPIEEDDLRTYLAKHSDCQVDQIYFSSVDQVDFLKAGYDQAVVVASTCMTGTAGPDVHAVFTRDEDGEIKELAMQELKLPHAVLFGNANSEFRIGDGVLVEVFHDTSDRDDPLIVKYKWNAGKQIFEIVSVEAAPQFKTSYDCARAEKDQDGTALAICYVESLADLDVELAEDYRAYLALLNAEERKKVAEDQRAWLKERNQGCVIYKGWVECLDEAYKKRIAELKAAIKEKKKGESTATKAQ